MVQGLLVRLPVFCMDWHVGTEESERNNGFDLIAIYYPLAIPCTNRKRSAFIGFCFNGRVHDSLELPIKHWALGEARL